MVTEEYSSNSIASKKDRSEKVVHKVTTGNIQKKEKSQIAKVRSDLGLSDFQTVISYIFKDVMLPAFKKLISEMINNGADIWLYGERQDRRDSSTRSRVSYRSYYDDRRDDRPSVTVRGGYDLDDVIFDEYADAEEVLNSLDEMISQYRVASVADFYELCGIEGEFTDNKYGWSGDLSSARISRTRDGRYFIRFPRPMAIK